MKKFLCSLALLACPFLSKAANPAFENFYGTNKIIVRTNAGPIDSRIVEVSGHLLQPGATWLTNLSGTGAITNLQVGNNGIRLGTNGGVIYITNTWTLRTNDLVFAQMYNETPTAYATGTNQLTFTTGYATNVSTNATTITLDSTGYYFLNSGFTFNQVGPAPTTNGPTFLIVMTNGTVDSRFTRMFTLDTSSEVGTDFNHPFSIASEGIGWFPQGTAFTLHLGTTNNLLAGHTGTVWNVSLGLQLIQGQTASVATTNVLIQTNGVDASTIGTLNFDSGITGYVSAGVLNLGVNVAAGSGTNALYQTNGVDIGTAGTLNFTTGVTGYLSSGVVFAGVTATGGGDAGGTNSRQGGSLVLTNLSGNPIPYTNIIVADVGIALGTNSGITYITNTIATNAFQPATANLTNWSLYPTGSFVNVAGGTFLTNWANAISNYVTAATNSASVTGWVVLRQPANIWLTNISGTGAITNLVNASTSGATWLGWIRSTNNGDALLKTVTGSGNITITDQGTNIDIATSGAVGEANINGEVSLTNNATGIYGLVYDKVGITNRLKAISAGANIVITNAGTNLWIASTATGGGADVWTNTGVEIITLDTTLPIVWGPGLTRFYSIASNRFGLGITNSAFYIDELPANMAVGHDSMVSIGVGSENTAFGNHSLYDLTVGAQNTMVGSFSGENIVDGSQNVGVGSGSLDQLISGSFNTALGVDALTAITTSQTNTAVGYRAGFATTGDHNVLLGAFSEAPGSISSGVAVGHNAVVKADNAIAIGSDSEASGQGSSISIGKSSYSTNALAIAIGASATARTNGAIAIGTSAYSVSTDGIALGANSAASFGASMAIGKQAKATNDSAIALGWTSQAVAVNSVAIGADAIASNSTSVALGAGARTRKSNQIMLGTASETSNIPGKAEINLSLLLSNVTASKIAVFDPNRFVTNSTVDAANLGYLTAQNWTNLIGTGAITNLVNASTSGATWLGWIRSTNNGDALLKTVTGSGNVTITDQGTNIDIATSGAVGEANVNGEVSVTNNANGIYGLVYDKSGVTNRLKSISQGNGIIITNNGTNLPIAIDPAVVASQANLTSESNFLVGWSSSISNLAQTKQNGSAVLTNLVGTVANNVTNVVSLSTTNATSKPLTNSYTAGVLTLRGLEAGANITLTANESNYVIATSGAVGEANVNGEVSVTNDTRVGLVYGKAGITNLLRSIEGMNGIVMSNQSTNIAISFDVNATQPAIGDFRMNDFKLWSELGRSFTNRNPNKQSRTFTSGYGYPANAIYVSNYVIVGTALTAGGGIGNAARLVRFDANDVTVSINLTNANDSEHGGTDLTYPATTDILYLPSRHRIYETFYSSNQTTVTEVDIDNWTASDVITDTTEKAGPRSMTTDGTFLYVLTSNNIVKYQLSDWSRVSSMTTTNLTNGTAIRYDGSSLWAVGGGTTNTWLLKINTNLTQVVGQTNISTAGHGYVANAPVFAGHSVYLPVVTSGAGLAFTYILECKKTNMALNRIAMNVGDSTGHFTQSLMYDGKYVFGPTEAQPGHIIRYDPERREMINFKLDAALTEDDGYIIVGDGQRKFWMNRQTPFKIVRFSEISFDPQWIWSGTNNDIAMALTNGVLYVPSNTVSANIYATDHLFLPQGGTAVGQIWTLTNASTGAGAWSNAPAAVGGDAGGTNSRQFGTLLLTNLSNNPYTGYTNQVFGGTNISVRTIGGTNFIDTFGELNNWSLYPTSAFVNVLGGTFLTNWANAISNLAQTKQNGTLILTNLSGTGAITNLVNASTSGATWLGWIRSTNNGDALLKTITGSGAITLTDQGTNIDVSTSGGVGEANVNGEVSLTNNANGIYGLVYDKVGITNRIKSISSGANIVITNSGTNLWIASTASGGGLTGAALTNFNSAEHTNWMALDSTIKGFTNTIFTDFEKKPLTTGVDRAQTIFFHSNMLFVGIQDAAPRLIKFSNPNDLSVYSQTNFFNISTHFGVEHIFYSESKGKLIVYFGNSADVVVYEVDTGTLATNMVVKQLQADFDDIRINDHYSATTDGTNFWIVGNNVANTPSFNVAQWRISDWTYIGNLDYTNVVNSGIQFGMPIGYDQDSGRLYSINKSNNMLWAWSAPASNMSNWTARTSTTQSKTGASQFGTDIAFVGNYGYVTEGANVVSTDNGGTNFLLRLNKTTLDVDRISVPQVSSNRLTGIYSDGRYLWLTTFTNGTAASSLIRFNPATLETDYAEFGATNNGIWGLTGDGTNTLYAVGRNAPGDVYRIRAPIVNGTVISWLQEMIRPGSNITISNENERYLRIASTASGSGISSVWSNGTAVVTGTATNLNFITGSNMTFQITNNSGRVDVMINANTQGSGLSTNANQFGPQVTLTIAEQADLTNTTFWPSNLTGPAIIATATTAQVTNLVEWRGTNGVPCISVNSNGAAFVYNRLDWSNNVAFRTNFAFLNLCPYQAFTNALKTNIVLQLTNVMEGVTTRFDAYGAGRLGNGVTNAWNIFCTTAAGTTIYWPPGVTNGNFDVLVNSNQVVSFTFMGGLGSTNILAAYRVMEGTGAN